MKTAGAEPDAMFIPPQDFDTGTGAIAEGEGSPVAPVGVKIVGDVLREGVDAPAHVNRRDGEKELFRAQHDAAPAGRQEAARWSSADEYRRGGKVRCAHHRRQGWTVARG